MSNADIVDLTDAMVSSLAGAFDGGRLASDIDVKRVYIAEFKLEKLVDLAAGGSIAVRLSPEDEPDQESGQKNQAYLMVDSRIQVAFAAKVSDVETETVDPILYLLQQLRDYFFKASSAYRPTGRTEVATDIETVLFFDRQTLVEKNVVASIFFLTFKTLRRR